MGQKDNELFVGNQTVTQKSKPVTGRFINLFGEPYYRIGNSDQMPPFFMSLVSHSDHWLFIGSNGGLTAGRTNADSALFPYETEDKILANADHNGSKSLIRVKRNGRTSLWEPFSERYAGLYDIERHLYKNVYGNKLIFEEVNQTLQLTMRLAWRVSDRFGFVKSCWLHNTADQSCQIHLLDGFQNILPFGASDLLQNSMSNLLNAYKRNELDAVTGLGIFALSATLTDRAEPSESLKATVAWQVGLSADCYLLSGEQVDAFRYGRSLSPEQDVLGKAGAYFVHSTLQLTPNEENSWHMVADVNQDASAIAALSHHLTQDSQAITHQLEADIAQGSAALVRYVASADGLQHTAQQSTTVHHFANVLFNIMRGGIFANGYTVMKDDVLAFVQERNRPAFEAQAGWFETLPPQMHINQLYEQAAQLGDSDIIRLCYEYLPLTFSRRHGDPSRPWNQFSINLKQADGSPKLDYQGNWRDIFQNWEPLLLSFPSYLPGVIAKFLNATSADGYNPYRVTRSGIEWEVPEPDNPWANIGYWSDHQIIYLQKLLELSEQLFPGQLAQLWERSIFAYTNVPYRLKPYQQMIENWYSTIDFDWEVEKGTQTAVSQMGSDGRLLLDEAGQVIHATMLEKLLVLLLAKITNLVPEGGIWMNTQRPEWNDANNALVGKGLSVVTAAYLRRFITFWHKQVQKSQATFQVNDTLATLFHTVQTILSSYAPHLSDGFNSQTRKAFMDRMGEAATIYRTAIYHNGIPQEQHPIQAKTLAHFLEQCQAFIEQTLQHSWREDGLAHTYNILKLDEDGATIEPLYLMLEGQVAMLSSGMLTAEKALSIYQQLRQSDLYRADQHSYMLYPNRKLNGFRQKNNVSADQVASSKLVATLVKNMDRRLIIQDRDGTFHFNGRFRNSADAEAVLDQLAQEAPYAPLVTQERQFILDLFETTFNHNAFTGRSGTFFAYEGLGSIYWHMVSKLLLAIQECYQRAIEEEVDTAVSSTLATAYYDIRSGIGFNKTPEVYGAFPTDPYSHTPFAAGAKQPGMTGQVKEEILTRWGELGVTLQDGKLCFNPTLLREDEFLETAHPFNVISLSGDEAELTLPPDSLGFTFCQLPTVYTKGESPNLEITFQDGRIHSQAALCLEKKITQSILNRDGTVKSLHITIAK